MLRRLTESLFRQEPRCDYRGLQVGARLSTCVFALRLGASVCQAQSETAETVAKVTRRF